MCLSVLWRWHKWYPLIVCESLKKLLVWTQIVCFATVLFFGDQMKAWHCVEEFPEMVSSSKNLKKVCTAYFL